MKIRLIIFAYICSISMYTSNFILAEEDLQVIIDKPVRDENNAIIRWITDIPATSEVLYGIDRNLETQVVYNELVMGHEVKLTELEINTEYYYQIKSVAENGKFFVSEIFTFWTDITPPTINVLTPTDRTTVSGITMINIEAADNIGIFEVGFYLDGKQKRTDSTPPFEISWDTSGTEDGEHVLFVYVTDVAGNFDMETITVIVKNRPPDTTAPVVRIISPVDGQVIMASVLPNLNIVKIIIDATDDQDVYDVYCLINREEIHGFPDNPPYEWEWWEDVPGNYTLQAKAKDKEGNIGESPKIQVRVVTDITPPVTQDNYQFNNIWTNQDATIRLTATDDITGVKETYYTIDGGTQQTGTNIIIIQEGVHTVQYWSQDNAGNVESKHTITVKIDKTPPMVAIYTDSAEDVWPPDNKTVVVTVRGSATDELSGVASKVFTVTDEYNEISPSLSDFNQTIELLASRRGDDLDGRTYTIKVNVTDNAGNSASGQTTVIVPHDRRK